jgi:hypothetical protein
MRKSKERYYLNAETIYNYMCGDDELETAVMCKPEEIDLATSDQNLYEALGSIEDRDTISYHKLVKFLENVDVVSHRETLHTERSVLTHARAKEIQQLAKQERLRTKGGK